MKNLIFILATYLFSHGVAMGYQLRVVEKVYRPSCSYFTVVNGEYHVLLNAPELMDSVVEMQYGWNGYEMNRPVFWADLGAVKPARKFGKTLVFSVERNLISRGSPYRYNGFSFRFKVMRPGGRLQWITPGLAMQSAFTVKSDLSRTPCLQQGEKISFHSIQVTSGK